MSGFSPENVAQVLRNQLDGQVFTASGQPVPDSFCAQMTPDVIKAASAALHPTQGLNRA